jgi:hypothetical protein
MVMKKSLENSARRQKGGLDAEKFVSMFSQDGYMWNMASGKTFRGQAIDESIVRKKEKVR